MTPSLAVADPVIGLRLDRPNPLVGGAFLGKAFWVFLGKAGQIGSAGIRPTKELARFIGIVGIGGKFKFQVFGCATPGRREVVGK